MKRTVKLIALLCALLMIVSLAACGSKAEDKASSDKASSDKADGGAEVTEAPSNLTDFEWVKFEMPEGFKDSDESSAYITIEDEADNHHLIKIFKNSLYSGKTLEDKIADEMEYSQNVSIEDAFEVNGRSWTPAYFDFNERSVKLFTQLDDATCCYLVVYDHLEDDAAVQTLLKTMEFVPEKF